MWPWGEPPSGSSPSSRLGTRPRSATPSGPSSATGRVDRCVVVDDGSTDDTAARARAAGATTLILPVNWGKGDAVRFAVEQFDDADVYLLVDADLGSTAHHTVRLLDPVLDEHRRRRHRDVPSGGGRGGFGVVKRAAGWVVRRTSGYSPVEPLSGQRAVRGDLLRRLVLAPRFGLEVAMTIDATRAGARIVEIAFPVDHEHTGRTWRGFAHRGGQAVDIARGAVGRIGSSRGRRAAFALMATLLIVAVTLPALARDRGGDALGAGIGRRPIVLVTVTNTSLADLDRHVLPNVSHLMASTGGALTPRHLGRTRGPTVGVRIAGRRRARGHDPPAGRLAGPSARRPSRPT